jgi:type IV pilus assembly protein PilF
VINLYSKATMIIVILFFVSACETTRQTSTNNIGSSGSQTSSLGFDKKKAAVNRVNSGLTYLNHNNFERAKFHLDKALSYDPDSGNVNYALGVYYQRVNDLKSSQKHFTKALSEEPRNPLYLNAYGSFLCEKGDYVKAEKALQDAISIPTYSDVSYAYYNFGFCALRQNKITIAEDYFRKALKRNRHMSDALIEIAKIEFNKKRYSRALSYIKRYEDSRSITPESAWLALRAAHYIRDKDAIARYGLILEQKFPDSDETVSYLDEKKQWM